MGMGEGMGGSAAAEVVDCGLDCGPGSGRAEREGGAWDSARGSTRDSARAQPIAPSRLTLRRLRASTANSIGSSLNTSLQKPFTIIDTASSAESPRLMQ